MPNDWKEHFYKEWRNIDDQCLRRAKFGEMEYKDIDVTESQKNLMTRDLLQEIIEERMDVIFYEKCQIMKLKALSKLLRANET